MYGLIDPEIPGPVGLSIGLAQLFRHRGDLRQFGIAGHLCSQFSGQTLKCCENMEDFGNLCLALTGDDRSAMRDQFSKPSAASTLSASRSGVRETPNCV